MRKHGTAKAPFSAPHFRGEVLSEIGHPERIFTRRRKPILQPEADYELAGVYGNRVFSNGLVVDDDGAMVIYYAAADSICAGAATTVDEIIAAASSEH